MNFINVVVHTTEDLNYRVYLQHEFSLLGIDEYLEDLEARSRDFPNLTRQIKAYQDNYFNVDILVGFVILSCISDPLNAPMYVHRDLHIMETILKVVMATKMGNALFLVTMVVAMVHMYTVCT